MKKRNVKKGFTLVELIVVIAIIGILAAVVVPRFTNYQQSARRIQVVTNAKQIATAIDAWQANSPAGAWPADTDDATIIANAGVTGIDSAHLTISANGVFSFTQEINSVPYTAGRTAANAAITVSP